MALIQHLKPHNPTPDYPGTFMQFGVCNTWSGSGGTFDFPITLGSGDLVVGCVYANTGGPVTLSGGSASYTQTDSGGNGYMFYGTGNGSAASVTVNGSSQWGGVALNFGNTSGSMVAHAIATGSSSSPSVTVNVPATGQLVVVWLAALGLLSGPNGWEGVGGDGNLVQAWYKNAPSSGNITATWSTNNVPWAAFAAVFS